MADNKSRVFTSRVESFGPPMIGALLRMPWERVVRRMLERLHANGFQDVEMAHVSLLLYPGPQGLRPSELAAQRGMSKQAANYLLGQLERLGYLERRPDPDDGRSKRIVLTDRGQRAARTIRYAVTDVERDWEAKLGKDRFAHLKALLVELN
ncbi:MAG: MarR family winged helix-turn-helix transcriptional regulator, partial [Solirubrobacteraceae bacterium]